MVGDSDVENLAHLVEFGNLASTRMKTGAEKPSTRLEVLQIKGRLFLSREPCRMKTGVCASAPCQLSRGTRRVIPSLLHCIQRITRCAGPQPKPSASWGLQAPFYRS